MSKTRVYLDFNATTPVAQEVYEGMLECMKVAIGNPSSVHWAGRTAKQYLNQARRNMASLLSVSPRNLVFTSGATESNNLVLQGITKQFADNGKNHLVISNIEHPATRNTAMELERMGMEVTFLDANAEGIITAESVRNAIHEKTLLVSVMAVNNETGVIQPFEDIGKVCQQLGVFFHCDLAQSIGKIPISLDSLAVDFASFSAHKFYGPRGVGGLYFREKKLLSPVVFGGGQEQSLRPGTENLPGIVGMGLAAKMIEERLTPEFLEERAHLCKRFETHLLTLGAKLNGHASQRVWNTCNVRFEGINADAFFMRMDMAGVAFSRGSACSAGSVSASQILLQMGLTEEQAQSSFRFSLGYETTEEDIDYAMQKIEEIVEELRKLQTCN